MLGVEGSLSTPILRIMNKVKKIKKNAKNIGGTLMPNGAELDPDKELCLIEHETKGQEAYYKGEKMSYMDYYAELADREIKVNNGFYL